MIVYVKLDSCVHMFGAVTFQEVPQSRDLDGVFLPTALHSDDLPTSFICRHYLSHVTSTWYLSLSTFLSLSGALLVSCRRYSVAWIPAGIAIQDKQQHHTSQPSADTQWLQ